MRLILILRLTFRLKAARGAIVGDLLETFRPIVAATGEDLDRFVHEMDLDAIPIEFDLMYPALAAGHLLD
jgi:hypothetical protein